MFCSKCGANCVEGASHCGFCGAPLAPKSTAAPTASAPDYSARPALAPLPSTVMSVISMVLGITALELCCLWFLAMPFGIAGIILGAVSGSKAKHVGRRNGFSTAAIVCSSLAIGFSLIFAIIAIVTGESIFEIYTTVPPTIYA